MQPNEDVPTQWHGLTWKLVVTTVVLGLLTGVSTRVGDIAAGKFELWMLFPMLKWASAVAALLFLLGLLWTLYVSSQKLTAKVAALENKPIVKKDRKDKGLEALRNQLYGEIREVKVELQALRNDMRLDSQSHKESIQKVSRALAEQVRKNEWREQREKMEKDKPVPTVPPLMTHAGWQKVVEIVKEQHPNIGPFLAMATFISAENGEVTIGYLPTASVALARVQRKEALQIVSSICTELLSQPMRLRVVELNHAQRNQKQHAEYAIQSAQKIIDPFED